MSLSKLEILPTFVIDGKWECQMAQKVRNFGESDTLVVDSQVDEPTASSENHPAAENKPP